MQRCHAAATRPRNASTVNCFHHNFIRRTTNQTWAFTYPCSNHLMIAAFMMRAGRCVRGSFRVLHRKCTASGRLYSSTKRMSTNSHAVRVCSLPDASRSVLSLILYLGQIGVLFGDGLSRSVPSLPIEGANVVGQRSVWVQPTAMRRCSAPPWMVLTM
jgi:hypothetical protein